MLRRGAIVLAYTVAFWGLLPLALWTIARALDGAFGWALRPWLPGAVILLAGAALTAWCIVELWRDGGGLPISALPPPRLARGGPYRWMRHPIYVGFNVMVLGAGLLCGSHALAFVVAPAFAPLWILYAIVEERGLRRRFGDAYERYRAEVGLLPGFGRRRAR